MRHKVSQSKLGEIVSGPEWVIGVREIRILLSKWSSMCNVTEKLLLTKVKPEKSAVDDD